MSVDKHLGTSKRMCVSAHEKIKGKQRHRDKRTTGGFMGRESSKPSSAKDGRQDAPPASAAAGAAAAAAASISSCWRE